MFGHFPELIIILALALIVFGPEKLPEVAANAGKMVREFRDLMDSAINPRETQVPEDFTQYYYESLSRAGEPAPQWDSVDVEAADEDGFVHAEAEAADGEESSGVEAPTVNADPFVESGENPEHRSGDDSGSRTL